MDNLPQHVALIPDGNRRWAALKQLPNIEGHKAGADRMHEVVDALIQHGIKYLTVWGFSCDNWKRSPEEVQDIFRLLQLWIEKDTPWLHEKGVRLTHIGRFDELPQSLQRAISEAMTLTDGNTGMVLNLAFNYSGRAEILDAARRLVMLTLHYATLYSLEGIKPSELVPEELFRCCLYTDGTPDVDLVIRTAGEFRLSNFMLWQTAYSELYFTDVFWPDFTSEELEKALEAYAHRERTFGGG